jgi:protocatechuate 3,4-dioxygenase beta subunit
VPPAGTGLISGSVLQDTNFNSFIDFADTPLSGVQVMLQSQTGTFLAQTFTDVNGAYAFANLAAGTYRVVQVAPANFTALAAFAGSGAFVLNATTIQVGSAGGASVNNNFLDRATVVSPTVGTISGSVLRDLNGNGVIDAGDAPASGVIVQLFTQLNVLVAQTTTDANGAYAFANIPPGFYRVVEVVPAGTTASASFAGTNGSVLSSTILQVTSVAGAISGNNNFLLGAPVSVTATISGSVLQDNNGTGTINAGDTALQGVVVQLRNQFGSFLANAVTDVNGAYAFSGLAPGTYQVVQIVPANSTAVAAFAGAGGVVLNATTIQVSVNSNVSGNNNFLDRSTVVSPTVGILSGSVVSDVNGNGFIDANDTGLPGVTIVLFNGLGTFIAQTTTDANGAYAFNNLPPGSYQILQVLPSGVTALTSTLLAANVVAGTNQGNNNFLDRTSVVSPTVGAISGSVVQDINGNGVIGPGDTGVAGVTVQLFTQLGVFISQTTTDANGAYAFANIPPGSYQLSMIVPGGFTAVTSTVLVASAVAGTNQGNNNFLIRSNSVVTGANTISGFAIRDTNLNGVADNELGLAGMIIVLRNSSNIPIASTTTDVTGGFSFSGLANGSYTLTATPPAGLTNTNAIPGQGGVRLSASTISVTTSAGTTSYPSQLFLAGP